MLARLVRHAALGGVVATLALAPAAVPAQDYSYAFRVMPSDGEPFTGSVRVSGHRARIDAQGMKGSGATRDYLLLSDGGRRVTVVNPRERSYSVTDARSFEQIVGAAMRAVKLGVAMQLSDVRISTERLGPGDTISGHPTERYRLTQEYAATVGVMGMKGEPEYHVVITDYWVAPGVRLMRNPLVEMLATTPTALAQSDRAFVARSAAARDQLFTGMPLRLIVAARSTGGEHSSRDASRTLIEVTRVVRGPVDRAALEVPKHFHARRGQFDWSFRM